MFLFFYMVLDFPASFQSKGKTSSTSSTGLFQIGKWLVEWEKCLKNITISAVVYFSPADDKVQTWKKVWRVRQESFFLREDYIGEVARQILPQHWSAKSFLQVNEIWGSYNPPPVWRTQNMWCSRNIYTHLPPNAIGEQKYVLHIHLVLEGWGEMMSKVWPLCHPLSNACPRHSGNVLIGLVPCNSKCTAGADSEWGTAALRGMLPLGAHILLQDMLQSSCWLNQK